MAVAKEARQRVHGVSAEDSATDMAGTVCGRLALVRSISPAQLEAAKAFAATYAAYQRALGSPRPPKAVEISAATGLGGQHDISPEQYTKAIAAWEKVKKFLALANGIAGNRGMTLLAACDYLVLRDEYHLHLVPDLSVALSYLIVHYGLGALAAT